MANGAIKIHDESLMISHDPSISNLLQLQHDSTPFRAHSDGVPHITSVANFFPHSRVGTTRLPSTHSLSLCHAGIRPVTPPTHPHAQQPAALARLNALPPHLTLPTPTDAQLAICDAHEHIRDASFASHRPLVPTTTNSSSSSSRQSSNWANSQRRVGRSCRLPRPPVAARGARGQWRDGPWWRERPLEPGYVLHALRPRRRRARARSL